MSNGIVNAGLETQFASLGINGSKSAYVPPHLRNAQRAASTPPTNGAYEPLRGSGQSDRSRGSAFGNGPFASPRGRGDWGGRSTSSGWTTRENRENRGGDSQHESPGYGIWRNGTHIVGPRNMRMEKELFGDPNDPSKQHTGINFEKYDDIPVEATGAGVPDPVTTFTNPPLDPLLLETSYSIPIVAADRDLMACAQTGSGKTAGFLFPILSASFASGPRPPPAETPQMGYARTRKAYPTALILAPTRELVSQIHEEARKFAYRSWLSPCRRQLRQIERGCDLLSATPGRLVDLIERGRISLNNIRYLVLDEADRMLDMGFEPQIRRIVQGEDMPGVHDRQTLMFSATFPRDIQLLARDFLKDYIFLSVGRVGSTSENITQKVEYVEDHDKRSVLLDILASEPPGGLTLIFVETKRMADMLSDFLMSNHLPATSIHGDRSQREREMAFADFPYWSHSHPRCYCRGCSDLIELLREANQEIPAWLDQVVQESTFGSGYRGRGRGGSRGGRGGSRDYRQSGNSYGGGYSGGGGRGYGGGPSYGGYGGGNSYGNSGSSWW
ncbi:P-loop containing nucleoside triphosphate hydrolase protein [Pisolithus tinctorius]|nr:P-loop containing nucleoside triphosphate hydrolase protein [Pisolithus tinctorius]